MIHKNNKRENAGHNIEHTYQVGDKVLLRHGTENKYEAPYAGPFTVLRVNDNGTVRLMVKSVEDSYNIRRLEPYHSETDPDHGGVCNMQNSRKRRRR